MNTELSTWLQAAPEPIALAVLALAQACEDISAAAADAALRAPQTPLDVIAHRELVQALASCACVAAWASDASTEPEASPVHGASGQLLVVFNAIDGASNIQSNITCGTIFSILPHPFRGTQPHAAAFLQPGDRQLAAGYVVYGPSTVLVLSVGEEVCQFTLERGRRRWLMTRSDMRVPARTRELAINAANVQFWEPPVQRYVSECLAGESGPRRVSFDMRWLASLVADVHRIMTFGGVYLDPREVKEPRRPGRLCLLYEAAPMAFLMQRTGAAASTGTQRVLETEPETLRQRVPLVLGSREEVERIVAYHDDPNENVSMQLFRDRSLFVLARS